MSAAIGWNRRMHPSTNDRLPLLGSAIGWPPFVSTPFKTYQGTAHAVPASAVAAHPERSRADAEQHGLLSILGSVEVQLHARPFPCVLHIHVRTSRQAVSS